MNMEEAEDRIRRLESVVARLETLINERPQHAEGISEELPERLTNVEEAGSEETEA